MNIYCIIFMCTFGSNNTETEVARSNSLLESMAVRNSSETDIASMILPQKGSPVPQISDIVMDLPDVAGGEKSLSNSQLPSMFVPSSKIEEAFVPSPSLSDILLPPSPTRNRATARTST